MYDEHNYPENDQPMDGSAPEHSNEARGGYQWNNPAPESGSYGSVGGTREVFRTPQQSTPEHSSSAHGTAEQFGAQQPFSEAQKDAQSSQGWQNTQQTGQNQYRQQPYGYTGGMHEENARPLYERPHFTEGFHGHTAHHSENGGNRPPRRNGSGKGKIVALAVVCALAGGIVGGVAGSSAGNSFLRPSTTVTVSDRTVNEVKVLTVDGKTAMTNAENYATNVNSVVSINVGTQTNYFGQTVEQASSGSGFILTADGYILTNYHVVEGATSIKVTTYAGETYEAEYIGGDEDYDIAVIKVDVKGLTPVVIGNSDLINVGDDVIAIGNPLGELTFSLSSGSVSSANRAITVDSTPFNMIQTDCAINPGNSGGPLFNRYGEVIGIVSAKYSTYSNTTVEGLGFAIPINDVYAMVEDIMENGYVTDKAYLGITGGSVTQQMQMQYNLPASSGVYVYSVEQNGAAAQSGLRPGDIIIKLGDKSVTSMTDLLTAKKGYHAGDTASMTVNRSGEEVTFDFTFGTQPQEEASTDADQSSSGSIEDYYNYYNSIFGFGR